MYVSERSGFCARASTLFAICTDLRPAECDQNAVGVARLFCKRDNAGNGIARIIVVHLVSFVKGTRSPAHRQNHKTTCPRDVIFVFPLFMKIFQGRQP